MDLLVRHKAANENVDQTVEAETQDHMDHTYGSCACAARALLTCMHSHVCISPAQTSGCAARALVRLLLAAPARDTPTVSQTNLCMQY
jgi:hypothetical protein